MILDLVSVGGKIRQACPELIENQWDPRAICVNFLLSLVYQRTRFGIQDYSREMGLIVKYE